MRIILDSNAAAFMFLDRCCFVMGNYYSKVHSYPNYLLLSLELVVVCLNNHEILGRGVWKKSSCHTLPFYLASSCSWCLLFLFMMPFPPRCKSLPESSCSWCPLLLDARVSLRAPVHDAFSSSMQESPWVIARKDQFSARCLRCPDSVGPTTEYNNPFIIKCIKWKC